MPALLAYLDPPPRAAELPAQLPSPFDPGPPHPLARRAAERLQAELQGGLGLAPTERASGQRGKMFGVLVVQDGDGRVGFLKGFSGMLAGSWHVDGFVGPLFDPGLRDAMWPAAEAELIAYDERLLALTTGAEATAAQQALAALDATHAAATAALQATLSARRERREARRATIGPSVIGDATRAQALQALAQESRADGAEERRLRSLQRQAREPLLQAVRALGEQRAALKQQRVARSCELLEQVFEGYQIASARGERRPIRALFAPAAPPGGSGDCAAPKLFGHAQRAGLRPLALAEFWWGPPPATGGRHGGVYYPACRGKCGPVLGHMLDGLAVAPAPRFGGGAIAAHEPETVFEDQWLVVVAKPPGLLSVPGRSGLLRDSVLTRLRARYPAAAGPLVLHRLDLDTSGLLLAAKDQASYLLLQRQFARREIDKRYVAWLEGPVAAERGQIDLALRVDLDDRPRQIHDPRHGKAALTEFHVLERQGGRTRVALYPRTGRTHQLRVHAAHPLGLGAPIVGDRLYGTAAERLLLHAEALTFLHPHTGARVAIERPAPF